MYTKTERTIAFHRKNILEAADKLFTKNGVEKTTMEQLAKEAGYSKPTLYGYFKDKDEVYFALVEAFMKELTVALQKNISDHATFYEKYLDICRTVYGFAHDYPLYFEGLIGNINVDIHSENTPQIYQDIYMTGQHINEILIKLIEEGKNSGAIEHTFNSNAILLFFWSSISGIVRMTLLKKEYFGKLQLDPNEFINFSFERLLCGCKTNKEQE